MAQRPEADAPTMVTPSADTKQAPPVSVTDPVERYKRLIRMMPDLLYYVDAKCRFLYFSDPSGILDYPEGEMMGRPFLDLVHPQDIESARCAFAQAVGAGQPAIRRQTLRLMAVENEFRRVEITCLTHFDENGQFLGEEGVCRDITEYTENRSALMTLHAALEEKVNARTRQLLLANEELEREIAERTITEETLRVREMELNNEKANLQRANTALKVLLKRRTEDRARIETEVLHNLKRLVVPYLQKIRSMELSERQEAYLRILESNLDDLPLTFSRKLSLKHYNLTPAEIRVANLIRKGRTTGEIARATALSKRTIDNHRQSIRKKLCIQNKRVNLRTYLLSIT